jgi:RNA polymerase sigma-70 factor (sigma-E family)
MRDEDGFTEFATANARRLRHIARLLTGDPDRAEDLLQIALARAYRRWDRIRGYDEPLSYVRRILVNAHTDWWRRRWRYELPADELSDRPADGDLASEHADRDQLARALAKLAPRERAVVVLRYYADLSEREIAQTLGVSPGTVKSSCARALAKLRLSAEFADPDHDDPDRIDPVPTQSAREVR